MVLGETLWVSLPNKVVKGYYDSTLYGEDTSDDHGEFQIECIINTVGSYQMQAKFEGDAEHDPCESVVRTIDIVTGPTAKSTQIDLEAVAEKLRAPTVVHLTGRLHDLEDVGVPNRNIDLYRDSTVLVSVLTDSDGYFSYDDEIEVDGAYIYWAYWSGDADYHSSKSDYVDIGVGVPVPPPPPDECPFRLPFLCFLWGRWRAIWG